MFQSIISIHAPHARSDCNTTEDIWNLRISIHAPHARSDWLHSRCNSQGVLISIHAPHARSDVTRAGLKDASKISIHAPHARSDEVKSNVRRNNYISIHAPHARSDVSSLRLTGWRWNFNPRSSCEERRPSIYIKHSKITISIHAPHARSDATINAVNCVLNISIHAPHARSDGERCDDSPIATIISIHAPHARSDPKSPSSCNIPSYFNPRSSCEERRDETALLISEFLFQSTLLMRGATS